MEVVGSLLISNLSRVKLIASVVVILLVSYFCTFKYIYIYIINTNNF